MANNCYFDMKIKGGKENCFKFFKKMESYDEENHFYRINPEIYDEGFEDGEYHLCINGDCAWSIETCCRASGYANGKDLFEINTHDLGLKLEVFSEEPGCDFQEHYVYENGHCLENECVDWHEYFWNSEEQTFEEYKREMGDYLPDNLTERDFSEEGYCYVGGFGEWSFSI